MKLLKRKKGFTLLEVLVTSVIMGIVASGVYGLVANGLHMWNFGTARMALDTEAKMTMLMVKKFVELSQGSSLGISRFDNSNCPANSYISGLMGETIYVSTYRLKLGCGMQSDPEAFGIKGNPAEIYQWKNYIRAVFTKVKPGTDLGSSTALAANIYYQTLTLSANCDSLNFVFNDSTDGTVISVAVRLSKWVETKSPPVTVFLKESFAVKHMHSSGYYN
jgi:prepilin-type N-terminal cleavage/methylation domain-containing protein